MSKKYYQNGWALEYLYHELGMSSTAVGEVLGCCSDTVLRYLREYGIPVREENPLAAEESTVFDWVFDKYVRKDMTAEDIADMLGCGSTTVHTWIDNHGIPKKTSANNFVPIELQDGEALDRLYNGQGLTYHEIASRLDCSRHQVQVYLDRHDIDRPGKGHLEGVFGEDHPMYDNGPSDYGPGWNPEKRRRVRERDSHTCQLCGYTPRTGEDPLDVHHLMPAKQFEDNDPRCNRMENLVALCKSCHRKWEGIPLKPAYV